MTEIDQFESVFKSAGKTLFQHEDVPVNDILVISDGDAKAAAEFSDICRTCLAVLGDGIKWRVIDGSQFDSVGGLLQMVGEDVPGLICTHRYLHMNAREYPYSLGTYLDVLTQVSATPVVVMPHPESIRHANLREGTKRVMAITDHFTGDNHLASWAAHLTQPGGQLWMTHVEDQATLERYLTTISKIPEIDTETARQTLQRQLLKEPYDYIESCRTGLRQAGVDVQVETIVVLGHHLKDYKQLIDAHGIQLLVLNTKDDDQLAMHGIAYSLTVELRDIPMLLL